MSGADDKTGASASRVRPVVGRKASKWGLWAFAVMTAIGGGALFASLESKRAKLTTSPIVASEDDGGGMIAPAPQIAIPADYAGQPVVELPAPAPPVSPLPVVQQSASPSPRAQNVVTTPSKPVPVDYADAALPAVSQPRRAAEVVYDAARAAPRAPEETADAGKSERVKASRLANPATTVPRGTVMQAVLESALDSSRAGLARAIISRDVYSFDGSHVLIARGSRLVGEYKADLSSGQSRALIQWQRLTRPDGAIINLDSPSADPLGRAGVKGKVNGHFLDRYSGAIMQSALDVGVQVAANKLASGTGVYALPGLYALPSAAQNSARVGQQNVQPTVTVKQGTSVSVFVAKDLDFTSVEP